MIVSNLSDISCTFSPIRTAFKASQIAASEEFPNGSRLLLMVPVSMTGSCGIIAILDRRFVKDMVEVSTPSMIILPSDGSIMRSKDISNVVLPEPDLPTIAIFSFACI